MNVGQIAGRHGSYMTQFVRPATSRYPNRAAMRKAASKKAVDRRLVLPLDTSNWVRALEVLGAGYARSGRTPEHYQQVIRCIVAQTLATPSRRRDSAGVIDGLRDQAYAKDIPVSQSLWVTLVWAYCSLNQPEDALECFEQAKQRFAMSTTTEKQMAEMLLPVLSRNACFRAAEDLARQYLEGTATTSTDSQGTSAMVSRHDTAWARRSLAEAAALQGEWERALHYLHGAATAAEWRPRTVNALFSPSPGPVQLDAAASGASTARTTTTAAAVAGTSADLSTLIRPALRQLLHSLAQEEKAGLAEQCWVQLYGDWRGGDSVGGGQQWPLPELDDVRVFLNCFGSVGRVPDVFDLFSVLVFGQRGGAGRYLSDEAEGVASPLEPLSSPQSQVIPLDPTVLHLVFAAFPRRDDVPVVLSGGTKKETVTIAHLHHPHGVVRLLDDLLLSRDDMCLTDHIMVTVGPALYQLGHYSRAVELLRHTPLLSDAAGARRAPSIVTESHRAVKERLASIVYLLHATTTLEVRCATLQYFPFMFPPEVFRFLPSPEELPVHVQAMARQQRGSHGEDSAAASGLSDKEVYARAVATKRPTSLRPSRHHYFPPRSSAELTEQQERAMRSNAAALQRVRRDAFGGSHAAAERDPRPVPKGLHDPASGWNYAGRGGEMVFHNSTRIAHPFSMRPKVMRSLGNPYRGWNPRQNSSIAHKENVIKWNGKSAV